MILTSIHAQVFRPVLGIVDDFSGEDLESALLVPNNRLGNIHIILLKVCLQTRLRFANFAVPSLDDFCRFIVVLGFFSCFESDIGVFQDC